MNKRYGLNLTTYIGLPTVPLFRTHVECHVSCVMCPAETFQKAEFSRFLAVRSNTNMLCPVKYLNIPLNTTSRPDFSVAQVGMYADCIYLISSIRKQTNNNNNNLKTN